MQPVEGRAHAPTFGAADPVIAEPRDDLPASPLGCGCERLALVFDGLTAVAGADPHIDPNSLCCRHRITYGLTVPVNQGNPWLWMVWFRRGFPHSLRDKCRAACQSAPQALNAAMAADGATAAVSQYPDTPWLGRLATTLLRCGSACRHHAPRTQLALVRGSTGNINAFVAAVSNVRDFGALGRPETGGGGRVGFGLYRPD